MDLLVNTMQLYDNANCRSIKSQKATPARRVNESQSSVSFLKELFQANVRPAVRRTEQILFAATVECSPK